MVNFLSLLAGLPNLEKRDGSTTSWTSVITTTFDLDPSHRKTSMSVYGYYYPATVTSNGVTYTTIISDPVSTSYASGQTAPLTSVFTPAASCFSDYSALSNDPYYLTAYDDPILELPGPDRAECFPDGYFAVAYYSPGICPKGYSVDFTGYTVSVTGGNSVSETFGLCCPT
jgi:hypothetical protein